MQLNPIEFSETEERRGEGGRSHSFSLCVGKKKSLKRQTAAGPASSSNQTAPRQPILTVKHTAAIE